MKTKRMLVGMGVFVWLCMASSPFVAQEVALPATTKSKEVLELYNRAVDDLLNSEFAKANALIDQALKSDPVFFMGYYIKSQFAPTETERKEALQKMTQFTGKLNKGEAVMKRTAFELLENPKFDVKPRWIEIVNIYPKTIYPKLMLLSIYLHYEGNVDESYRIVNECIALKPDYAPLYNVLGYVYLEQKQYDKAKEAFDKYIAMEANRPNPYDSKGDYFMAIKAFDEANVSFMRAFAMDSLFVESKQKANYAVKMKKMEEQRPVIDSLTTSLLHYFANDMDMYYSHFAKDYRFRFIFNGKLNATFQQMVEYDKKNLSSCKSIRFNITNQNVDMIEEKLAVANQNFDFEIDTNDGGTFKSSGYWSLLWRYMNGQWKIVHAIETSKIPEE